MSPVKPLSITGRRIVLAEFAESDITSQYIRWLNDPEVVRFSNQRFLQHDTESARRYFQSFVQSSNLFLAVRLAESDEAIGTMTAYISTQHRTADMGILLGERRCWGQGYGLEAWSLLMRHLFEDRQLRKITAGTLSCNVGMVKIMERSGMTLEGRRREQELVEGEPQDIVYFAKFPSR